VVFKAKTPMFSSSLNRITRLKELTRVNQENQNFLKRLRCTQSNYDIRLLEKNSQSQVMLMESLCRNSSKPITPDRFYRDNYFVRSPSINYRADGFSTVGTHRLVSAHSQKRLGTPGSTMKMDKNFQQVLKEANYGSQPTEDQRPSTAPLGKATVSRKQRRTRITSSALPKENKSNKEAIPSY